MERTVMKILLGLTILMSAMFADDCKTWTWNSVPIEMKTCKYDYGKSGYLEISNLSPQDTKLCWKLTYNNGDTSKGCKGNLNGYDTEKSSCFKCGTEGVRKISITKYKIR